MKVEIVLFSCLLYYVNSANPRVDPLVLINQGLVRGLKASDGSYSAFLGVPYASVNVDNPFGASVPHGGFGSEVFNAYDGRAQCPQSISLSSRVSKKQETLDCLKMNIYSPIQASTKNPLPVLVWFHGGDFAVGSASDFDAASLVKQGILVVSINYRLGPYGFMCLDIPTVPGNQGLKDQYRALNWVRENINAFGGNPYNVTIGGQEAGAASVLYHLYSDNYKLYRKVIVQGGTPQNIDMFVNSDEEAAIKLATHLGFNTADTQEALDFLTQSSFELVAAAASELKLQLKPCREKSFSGVENFIADEPLYLSNDKKVKNTAVLIGSANDEFADTSYLKDSDYLKSNPFYDRIKENFNLDEDKLSAAADIVRHFYIGDEDVSENLLSQLQEFESDIRVNHPLQRTITKLLSENANPIFEYEILKNAEINSIDLIEEQIISMWSNFIKHDNPTPSVSDVVSVTWTPVTTDSRPCLVIDSDLEIKQRIYNDRMAFWDLFYLHYEKNNKFSRDCKML